MTDNSVERAGELRAQALEETAAGRPAEAVKLLRRALHSLPVSSGETDVVTVRTRVLATLAYAVAETGSVADGLVHLGTANDLVSGLPDGPVQSALRGLVQHQHALIVLRQGHTAEALELIDSAIPLLR